MNQKCLERIGELKKIGIGSPLWSPNDKDMSEQFAKLTDCQWLTISPFLPLKRKLDFRDGMKAVLWLLRTGCQWRNLPDEYPHWQAVYYYFDQRKTNGTRQPILSRYGRTVVGRACPRCQCCWWPCRRSFSKWPIMANGLKRYLVTVPTTVFLPTN